MSLAALLTVEEDTIAEDKAGIDRKERVLVEEYNDIYKEITVFLTNGIKKRLEYSRAEYTLFRNKALKFLVRDN